MKPIEAEQLCLFTLESLEEVGDDSQECSKCNIRKPLSAFSNANGGKEAGTGYLRNECQQCIYEAKQRVEELRIEYGMPDDDTYECPICLGRAEEVKQRNALTAWVIDHSHETKEFRGWLCQKCNRTLGGFKDDIHTLQRAINYLEK